MSSPWRAGPGNGNDVEHTVAATSDGFAWAWGSNTNGQLGNGTTTDSAYPVQVKTDATHYLGATSKVVMVAAGNRASYALTEDGKVYAWGINNRTGWAMEPQPTAPMRPPSRQVPSPVADLTGIVQIAAGEWHAMALKNDGTVWCWGYNNFGQLGDGTLTNSAYALQVVSQNGSGHHHRGQPHCRELRVEHGRQGGQ